MVAAPRSAAFWQRHYPSQYRTSQSECDLYSGAGRCLVQATGLSLIAGQPISVSDIAEQMHKTMVQMLPLRAVRGVLNTG
eukprot:2262137-Rhodomonas_salina.2